MTELYQIYYREDQIKELYPFAIPHKNEGLTIFFENEVISRLVMASKSDKIGVCSWKLKEKLKWYVGQHRELTEEVINTEYDVLSFTRNSKAHQMLNAAELWHPGFKSILKEIITRLGISMPHEVRNPVYQNHFMARTEIYQDYVLTYLNPAMELIKNDPEIWEIATADSNYTQLARKDAASIDYLQEKIGLPHYPMAPFLLERLFSIYLHNKNINVTWL